MRSIFLVVNLFVISLLSVVSFASDNKEGKEVFELTCKSCHMPKEDGHISLDGKHEKRNAPPMAMVKKRYLKAYPERDDFVNAVAGWAAEPSKDSSLLKRAVEHHGVMPIQTLEKQSLKKVAAYIYDKDMGKAGCGMHGGKADGMVCGDKSGKGGCCGGTSQDGGCGSGCCDSGSGGCCSGHGGKQGEGKGSCSHH
jgi:mono/diheme cytochrome c family protein